MGFDASAACDVSSERATAHWMALGVAIAFAVFIGIDTFVGWWVVSEKLREAEQNTKSNA